VWLLLAVALWASEARLAAQPPAPAGTVLADWLPQRARQVMAKPTLFCHGPAEVFVGRPALYYWLLDHPDRGAQAWRRLGAPCLGITERAPGRFGWTDSAGSDVSWETVYRDGGTRVWYAEGKVRPFLFFPSFPVRVVVVLRYTDAPDLHRRTLLRQQADVYLHSDSKAAELVSKMLGSSAPRIAEQGLSQMGLFFSGLVWYMDRHPEQIGMLDR
jgi:hypothetical protein